MTGFGDFDAKLTRRVTWREMNKELAESLKILTGLILSVKFVFFYKKLHVLTSASMGMVSSLRGAKEHCRLVALSIGLLLI
jgi:hypothetical protein